MAIDATGTPTSLGIPTFDVDTDAPSGVGSNNQMSAIDALVVQAPRSGAIAGIAVGSVPVWNGTAWVKPSGTPDGQKFLRDDGSWVHPVSERHIAVGAARGDSFTVNGTGQFWVENSGTNRAPYFAIDWDALAALGGTIQWRMVAVVNHHTGVPTSWSWTNKIFRVANLTEGGTADVPNDNVTLGTTQMPTAIGPAAADTGWVAPAAGVLDDGLGMYGPLYQVDYQGTIPGIAAGGVAVFVRVT